MEKLLIVLLLINSFQLTSDEAKAQVDTSEVSCFIRIKHQNLKAYRISNFVLRYSDSATGATWTSKKLKPLEQDSNGYLVKVDVPKRYSSSPIMFQCTAEASYGNRYGKKTAIVEYGGVTLSNIKLILKSSPLGADAYLIPNRIWQTKIRKKKWQKDLSLISDYLVNTSRTDTFAHIDETVYVVIFKYEDKYVQRIHFTKPYSVEKEQYVNVRF